MRFFRYLCASNTILMLRYHLYALFAVTVWGATFVSTKVLIGCGLTPAEIFLIRFVLAYLCILPFAHRKWVADRWQDELAMAGIGLTGGSLYFLTENMALEFSPASNVSLIVCSAPLWTALLLSMLYRNERMNGRQIGGSLLAFAGMVLVILNGRFVLQLAPKGDLLALSAALLWMLYSLIIKQVGHRYEALFITRKTFFYGLLTILPWFLHEPFAVEWSVRGRKFALPGCRGLDALLPGVGRGHPRVGSGACHKLHLPQPPDHDSHRRPLHLGAHHPDCPTRCRPDSLRHVARGEELKVES